MPTDTALRFGSHTLAGPCGPLLHGDRVVHVPPKALAVLWLLVTNAGQVVTKARLFAAVWAGTAVGDEVLTSCLRTLRRALGDDAAHPQYIATVHRIGYRFLAPVGRGPEALASEARIASDRPPSTIVGRDAELERLRGLLAKARRGERQIAFVTGDAGIGKTALVETFLAEVDEGWIGGGQCVEPYGAAEAYLPVLEALGRLCRRADGARVTDVLERCAPSWLMQLPALLSTAAIEGLRHRVADVTRDRMLREMMEALEVVSEIEPLVLVLEDLHWSDASTIELLAALARQREPARLLVLGTYRSVELIVNNHPLKTVKHDLVAHGRCTEIALPHLGPEAVRAYVRAHPWHDVVEEDVATFVYRRTEGHPLFMVHMAAYLAEHARRAPLELAPGRALDSAVPLGLRELIEARAARLRDEERRILEAASVAGVEFTAASVAAALEIASAAVEEHCEHLSESGQLLEARGVDPLPDGSLTGRFGFRHALYREVLYRRVPELRRARMHRAVGEHLERTAGERASDIATELATHFEHGRDPRKAIAYYKHAGETAVSCGAHHEAAHCLTSALRLLGDLPALPERDQLELPLQLRLGTALRSIKGYAAPETATAFRRAAALCEGGEHARELFDAMSGLVTFQQVSGQLRAARTHLEGQMRIAARLDDAALMIVHSQMGDVLFWLGDLVQARVHLARTAALYEDAYARAIASPECGDLNVNVLSYLSWTDWYLGYADRAAETSERALAHARELAHPHTLAFALYFAARLRELRVDVEAQRRHADELLTLTTAHRFPIYGALALQSRGWALMQQGATREGIPRMREAIDAYATTGARLGRRHQHYLLAELHSRVGNVEDSRRVVAEADALGGAGLDEEECYVADCLRIRGEVILRADDAPPARHPSRGGAATPMHSEAEACFRTAVDVARRQRAKSLELRAATSLARLWGRQGRGQEAHQMLGTVYGWFTEGFETASLREAKTLLQQLPAGR